MWKLFLCCRFFPFGYGLHNNFVFFCFHCLHDLENRGLVVVTSFCIGVDNDLATHIWRCAPKMYNGELYVVYDYICETECLALLQSAKHWSDSHEAALSVHLLNEEVVGGRSTFKSGMTWI
jgi:hypothetical protein